MKPRRGNYADFERVMEALSLLQRRYPDQRIGQLLYNALRDNDGKFDPSRFFTIEDEDLIRALEDEVSCRKGY